MHIALERPAGLPGQQLEVHRFGQRRGAGGGDARHNRAATAIRFTMVAIIGMPFGPLSTAGGEYFLLTHIWWWRDRAPVRSQQSRWEGTLIDSARPRAKPSHSKRVWTDEFPAVALAECVAFIVVERAGTILELLDVAAGGGRGVEKQDAAGFAADARPSMRDIARDLDPHGSDSGGDNRHPGTGGATMVGEARERGVSTQQH